MPCYALSRFVYTCLLQSPLFVLYLVQQQTYLIVQQKTAKTQTLHLAVQFAYLPAMVLGSPQLDILEIVGNGVGYRVGGMEFSTVGQKRILQRYEILNLLVIQLLYII